MKTFYIQVHFWLSVLTASLFLEKGADAVMALLNSSIDGSPYISHVAIRGWGAVGHIILVIGSYIGAISFCIRYLFWTPWPIFDFLVDCQTPKLCKEKNTCFRPEACAEPRYRARLERVPNPQFMVAFLYTLVEWPLLVILIYNIGNFDTFILLGTLIIIVDTAFPPFLMFIVAPIWRYFGGLTAGFNISNLMNQTKLSATEKHAELERIIEKTEEWQVIGRGFFQGRLQFGLANFIDFLFFLPGVIGLVWASFDPHFAPVGGFYTDHFPLLLIGASIIIVRRQASSYFATMNALRALLDIELHPPSTGPTAGGGAVPPAPA